MVQALMLVDLQEDYLGASGLQPARGALVAQAAALLEGWRARGWPVIHAWTTTHDEPDDRMPHWREAGRRACVEGAPGHASPLVPAPGEAIVHKRFFSAFEDPGLERLLADLAKLASETQKTKGQGVFLWVSL